jgi:phosphoribosylanthranilate isomerase
MVRVKICGITTVDDAVLAESLGADAIGVVVCSDSPRSVPLSRAHEIFSSLGPFTTCVAVTHTRSGEDIGKILETAPDAIQVSFPHVVPPPTRVIRVVGPGDPVPEDCAAVNIDGSHGHGVPYDPGYAVAIVQSSRVPVILAGGLTPDTVRRAVLEIRPYAVDVASGVESSPGIKDPERLRAFIRECRT